MAVISNFTQAMKELTGFDESLEKNDENIKPNNGGNINYDGTNFNEQRQRERSTRPRNEIDMPIFDNQGGSVITKTMVIKGDVEGNDSLKIDGQVSGNIAINSNVVASGTIVGDVGADNLSIDGAIKGNIAAKGNVQVGDSAVIAGDFNSQNIAIDGKIKGNITVKDNTSISETAWISGDIDTGSIVTDVGCIINGKISTKDAKNFDIDEDKLFKIGE